jgi:hypothetical protein
MRDLRHGRDVDDVKRRIGWAFQEECLGVRPHGIAPGGQVAAVDQRRGDAEARQIILDDITARTEHRLRRHDVIAGLELADERQSHGGHSGCGRACRLGAFQRRHTPLEHVDGRIGEARILVARVLALEAGFRLSGIVVDIALGEKKRF